MKKELTTRQLMERREAVDFAFASVALEGLVPSDEARQKAELYAAGEIDAEDLGPVAERVRAHLVRRMLTNMRLEGIEPDEDDHQLLQQYIKGTLSLSDLMAYAKAYVEWTKLPQVMRESAKKLSTAEWSELHRKAVAEEKAKNTKSE